MIFGAAMKLVSPPLFEPKEPDTLSSHEHTGYTSKAASQAQKTNEQRQL